MPCIMGNHDEYCGGDTDLSGFNPHASHAIQWTREQLNDEERDWLRRLKYLRMIANFTIVHATLDAPKRWGYVMSKLDAAASFTYQNSGVCFFGHTHVPLAFVREQNTVTGGKYDQLEVERGKKYFVNIGSVGQPRDGDPRAAYGIYDMKAGTIELRRLEYDFEKTQAKIREADLPERLANRLALGK
jgi:diadenosine tetraphosphatase ApaH/serine/threonine PP2A family protein phosphatase